MFGVGRLSCVIESWVGEATWKTTFGKAANVQGRVTRDWEVTFDLKNCQDILGYFAPWMQPSYTQNDYSQDC